AINVVFQDYAHPTYPQQGRGRFEPNLSAIDLLFNCGPASRDIVEGMGTTEQGNQGTREVGAHAGSIRQRR
ncbi:MAG: WbqC family protein, partial [Phycisphaerae bacterium]